MGFNIRAKGALLGLACGDALGAPAEFKSPAEVRARWGTLAEMVGGGIWAPGEWTDDTGMALCVAEGLLVSPHDPVAATGERFLQWQQTAKDVGATIASALKGFAGDWAEAAQNTPQAYSGKAAGNGSLMRVLPVAIAYPDREQMLQQSARLSAMTHWDPQAEVCCAVYCLWVDRLLHAVPFREAWYEALEEARAYASRGPLAPDTPGPHPLPEGFWERLASVEHLSYAQLQPSGYAGYVVECLEAAVWCCLDGEKVAATLEEILVKAVNLAGEADTIAAVAGGAAGAALGAHSLPTRWLEKLHQRKRLEQTIAELIQVRRHLEIYTGTKLAVFEFCPVGERIMAGRNPLTEHDVWTLVQAGVTHVLDLREPREWAVPREGWDALHALEHQGLTRLNLPVPDLGAPSRSVLDQACAYLDAAMKAPNARVYIHCRAGRERTATILTAWYARRHACNYDAALHALRELRPVLHPLPNQEKAVRDWLRDMIYPPSSSVPGHKESPMIIEQIQQQITAGSSIPKPQAKGEFTVKGWGKRRGEDALIYYIPNHSVPAYPHQKGITCSEFEAAYRQLSEIGELTRSWFDTHLPACAKEGTCNFTTIGGVFQLLGLVTYERGKYRRS